MPGPPEHSQDGSGLSGDSTGILDDLVPSVAKCPASADGDAVVTGSVPERLLHRMRLLPVRLDDETVLLDVEVPVLASSSAVIPTVDHTAGQAMGAFDGPEPAPFQARPDTSRNIVEHLDEQATPPLTLPLGQQHAKTWCCRQPAPYRSDHEIDDGLSASQLLHGVEHRVLDPKPGRQGHGMDSRQEITGTVDPEGHRASNHAPGWNHHVQRRGRAVDGTGQPQRGQRPGHGIRPRAQNRRPHHRARRRWITEGRVHPGVQHPPAATSHPGTDLPLRDTRFHELPTSDNASLPRPGHPPQPDSPIPATRHHAQTLPAPGENLDIARHPCGPKRRNQPLWTKESRPRRHLPPLRAITVCAAAVANTTVIAHNDCPQSAIQIQNPIPTCRSPSVANRYPERLLTTRQAGCMIDNPGRPNCAWTLAAATPPTWGFAGRPLGLAD